MFRAILYVQWKWARVPLLLLTLVVAMVPLASARSDFAGGAYFLTILSRLENFGLVYPLAALLVGWLLAVLTWYPDREGRHVYGLSMPVPRWHFVLLRYGAGMALAAIPVMALGVSAVAATLSVHLPPGLQAYPGQLTLRFLLATMVAFSFMFAVMSGRDRAMGIALLGLIILLIVLPILVPGLTDSDVLGQVFQALFKAPGPFSIFAGRWMLFDV